MDETDLLHSVTIDVEFDGDLASMGIGWCEHLDRYQVWCMLTSAADQLRQSMASQS